MNDLAVRAVLLPRLERILESSRLAAELEQHLIKTELAIQETRNLIRRSDRLIQSISRIFGGVPSE